MELTQSQIEEINKQCPHGQGIFKEPHGIPTRIKELVVYTRYETGGMSGGNCWGGIAEYRSIQEPENKWQVLDILLSQIKPNITYLQYKKISSLIDSNEYTQREYYGNSDDYKVEFILLSDLLNLLETF